jgi:hypothetical protein
MDHTLPSFREAYGARQADVAPDIQIRGSSSAPLLQTARAEASAELVICVCTVAMICAGQLA